MKRQLVAFGLVLSAVSVGLPAEDLSSYDPVLLPIVVSGTPGGYSSVWSSQAVAYIDSDELVPIFPIDPGCDPCFPPPPPLPLRAPFVLRTYSGDAGPGTIIYVYHPGAQKVHVDLRVGATQSHSSVGDSIPIVRRTEFVEGTLYLLNLEYDPLFRSNLRVYSMSDPRNIQAEFRAIDNSGKILHSGVAHLGGGRTVIVRGEMEFRIDPDYAEIPIELPSTTPIGTQFRIEVRSLTPGAPIWTFATRTSYTTQEFIATYPQVVGDR